MNRPLLSFFLAAAFALGLASCSKPQESVTTDSTTGNAAAAADTAGAKASLNADKAGVKLDSAGTKMTDKMSQTGNAVDPATSNPAGK